MGILSKFEHGMEDGIENAAGIVGRVGLSPVQIAKKAERQMRREKMVGAGKQYAPTLYTVLVSAADDAKLSKYYPTLAGETETYLKARAREIGYTMDGQPLVRFLVDPDLKRGKSEVVAEVVTASIVEQLRDDEFRRYGLPTRAQLVAGRAGGAGAGGAGGGAGAGAGAGVGGAGAGAGGAVHGAHSAPVGGMRQVGPRAAVSGRVPAHSRNLMGTDSDNLQPLPNLVNAQSIPAEAVEAAEVVASAAEAEFAAAESAAAEIAANAASAAAAGVIPAEAVSGAAGPAAAGAAGPQNLVGKGHGVNSVFGDEPSNKLHVYLYDEARDTAYNLTGGIQTIGRESSNDVVVPDINISRVHAQICREADGSWVVKDLNSTNGVYVNGQKVASAVLRDADMITVGTSTLEFQLLA